MRRLARTLILAVPLAASCASSVPERAIPVHSATTPLARDGGYLERHRRQKALAAEGGWRLVFLGDSVTQGWESTGARVWETWYDRRRTLNLGISGDRTEHVLWRLQDGVLDGLDPALVVLMIGTNNSRSNTAREIADGVEASVRELRRRLPHTRVLLLAIFPRGATAQDPDRIVTAEASAMIRALADDDGVRWLDVGDVFVGAGGALSTDIMPDLLHLSEIGYQRWAEAIEPEVAGALRD